MTHAERQSFSNPPGGRRGRVSRALAAAFLLGATACGGARYTAKTGVAEMADAAGVPGVAQSAPSPPMAPEEPGGESPESLARGEAPPGAPRLAKTEGPQNTGEERRPGTLLIYEADYTVAVYQVQEAIDAVEAIAERAGGHLVERTDQRIVVRVPRERFEETLSGVDAVGDVVRREVRSRDVTDQYRDLEIRLRNSRAVRVRLEELLARAQTVKESLEIEQQLARITEEIERLSATLQSLDDRIAYSKITVMFQPRVTENVPDEVLRLPFPWLDGLGLSPLLNLNE